MEKERTSYMTLGFLISLLIYISTCAALFLIDRSYAGTLGSGFLTLALVIPPVRMLARVFGKESPPKGADSERKRNTAIAIFIGFLLVTYLFYTNRFHIDAYLILAVVIVAIADYIIVWRYGKKLEQTQILGMVYAAVLLAAVLFLVIVSPCSVSNAEKMIANRGYTDISLIGGFRNKKPGFGENAPILSGGYYFSCVKNGESTTICIDALSGEVVAESIVTDSHEL